MMATYNPYEGRKNKEIKIRYHINLPPDLKITDSSLHITTPELQQSDDSYSYREPIMVVVSDLCW